MDLINDLGTDLALAFMVEKRYRQKIDPHQALELIRLIRSSLEAAAGGASRHDKDLDRANESMRSFSAH